MNTTLHSVMDKYLAGFRKTCFVPLLTTIIRHLLYYYYYYYIFLIRSSKYLSTLPMLRTYVRTYELTTLKNVYTVCTHITYITHYI